MDCSIIEKVACIGTGIVSVNWATRFSINGIFVTIQDDSVRALEEARIRIIANLEYLYENKMITFKQKEFANGYIKCTLDLERAVHNVRFVQESVLGNLEIKRLNIEKIERYIDNSAIHASYGRGVNSVELYDISKRSENFLVANLLYPGYLVPSVEVVRGNASYKTFKITKALYKKIGFQVS